MVPLLDRKASIFNAPNEIIAHMAPPITCAFLLGVFWPSAYARSATWTMWLGSVLAGCGFEEAAGECSPGKSKPLPMNVDAIVQAVLKNIEAAQSR